MRLAWSALALVVLCAACNPRPATTAPESVRAVLDMERAWYPAPGALADVRVGAQEWMGSSGHADISDTAITPATRFWIGSITKTIVAVLVLKTVGRHQLSLDAGVDQVLPGVLRPGPAVTVRMLLDHTSGIFDETNDAADLPADVRRVADPALRAQGETLLPKYLAGEHVVPSAPLLVAMAETHDRYFPPGAGYHYSNINYELAGMVLERVTGESLPDLLQHEIVAPLGLRHTTIAPPGAALVDFRGYATQQGKQLADVTESAEPFGNGASGGIISTAGEVLTIFQALMLGRLIPRSLLAEMQTMTAQSGHTYGLGLAMYRLSCGTYYGHSGSVNGTESQVIVSPDGRSGAVFATNLYTASKNPDLVGVVRQLVCERVPR